MVLGRRRQCFHLERVVASVSIVRNRRSGRVLASRSWPSVVTIGLCGDHLVTISALGQGGGRLRKAGALRAAVRGLAQAIA